MGKRKRREEKNISGVTSVVIIIEKFMISNNATTGPTVTIDKERSNPSSHQQLDR
jgi:hypothetical protein